MRIRRQRAISIGSDALTVYPYAHRSEEASWRFVQEHKLEHTKSRQCWAGEVWARCTIRRVVERCLRKDVRRRLPDIAEARIEIEEAGTQRAATIIAPAKPPVSRRREYVLSETRRQRSSRLFNSWRQTSNLQCRAASLAAAIRIFFIAHEVFFSEMNR